MLMLLWGCSSTQPSLNGAANNIAKKNNTTKDDQPTLLPIEQTINQSNILQLNQMMQKKQLSAVQLTQYYIQQINRHNDQLNAVISINPKALAIAQQLDKERQAGKIRGHLHGVPLLIKDNIETKNMATTAGSLALKNNHTHRDAPIIEKLKKAGAIILGKTNLSEWANIRSERSSSGWSAVGGQTRNPHDINRSTCGSSSGSAAAVAAHLAVAAIGTETNGSITCPASANGIVGIKPTVGLLSRTGIVPISHTQDTAGPMTRSIIDAAIMLAAMQGVDPKDTATKSLSSTPPSNYLPSSTINHLKGKRIGILQSPALNHEGVSATFNQAKILLKQQGAILIENLATEPYDGFYNDSYEVLLYELKHDLNLYLSQLPNQFSSLTLKKLIQFNQNNRHLEMPYFQQEIFEKSQAKGALTEKAYLTALKKIRQATRKEGLDKLFKKHQLDVIVTSTLSPAWSIDRINGDHYTGGFSSYPAISGYPHITLPMGKVHHMPVGISFAGPALSEQQLIAMAYSFEKAVNYQY